MVIGGYFSTLTYCTERNSWLHRQQPSTCIPCIMSLCMIHRRFTALNHCGWHLLIPMSHSWSWSRGIIEWRHVRWHWHCESESSSQLSATHSTWCLPNVITRTISHSDIVRHWHQRDRKHSGLGLAARGRPNHLRIYCRPLSDTMMTSPELGKILAE